MSDFGSDMGNSGLSLMGKVVDALLKLLEKIFDTIKERTSAEYRLKKAEYGEVKQRVAFNKFVQKVEGRAGFVNHKQLEKAGVPLTATGVTLDDAGMKELAERCKREGIIITGVEDIRQRELTGNKFFLVECRQSDLPRLKSLIDLMNDEKRIAKVQSEIGVVERKNEALKAELAEIRSKGEPTAEDLDRIAALESEIEDNKLVIAGLNKQIDEIRYGHSQELNQEQAHGVVEQAVNGMTERGVTFDEAVDRWTGGKLDKDTTCYVVDAKDPERYIVCTGQNDVFREQEYVKTNYEVYNGSKQVYATNDGRFEGRPKGYWKKEKAAMKEKGGFGDLVLKFYSVKELEAYRRNYKKQNVMELDGLQVGEQDRNYGAIIDDLKAKIEECGCVYEQGYRMTDDAGNVMEEKPGQVLSAETREPMTLTEGMSEADRAKAAEAVICGKQIDNYKKLARLEEELAVARVGVLTAAEGTPAHTAAKAEFDAVEGKYKSALKDEEVLVEERKNINAVQAEHETREDRELDAVHEPQEKDVALEKGDVVREGHEVSADDKRHEMAEYKAKIAERRAASAAQGKDATVSDLAKGVKPKGRGER